MQVSTLLYFLGASVLLTLAPGPDNTFVIAQGLARGRRAAVITALGMCSGISVHTAAAALGISALLYSSSLAFSILKYAGAAYLLYLAFKTLWEQVPAIPEAGTPPLRTFACFRRGFLMNVLNPKVGLFFLAFLPQFVRTGGRSAPVQMALLGFLFMAQSIVVFTAIAYLSGSAGNLILRKPFIAKYFAWLSGLVFAVLGLRLAFAEP